MNLYLNIPLPLHSAVLHLYLKSFESTRVMYKGTFASFAMGALVVLVGNITMFVFLVVTWVGLMALNASTKTMRALQVCFL